MAGELPKYYWLKFGEHYIVTKAITAVHSAGLSDELKAVFNRLKESDEIDGCALPDPSESGLVMAAFSEPDDGDNTDGGVDT